MSRFALLCLLFSLGMTQDVQAATCEPGKVAQKYPKYAGKIVRIAAAPMVVPFTFADPDNPERMKGLEIEMIERVMSCAGLRYDYVKGPWGALLPTLFLGSTDVMVGAVNYRADRAVRADFVLYMKAALGIVVHRGNPRNISNLDSLCGKIGSSVIGGTPAQFIERQSQVCTRAGKPAIEFRPSGDTDASYRQVVNGRVDFVIDDSAGAMARVRREAGLQIAQLVPSDILTGFAVTRGNDEMVRIVADGLRMEEQDGTLARLTQKYGIPPDTIIPIEVRQTPLPRRSR